MAITLAAELTFTAGAGTTAGQLKSAGLFGGLAAGDRVYNATRNKYVFVTSVPDTSTVNLNNSILGQVAGNSVTISPLIRIDSAYDSGTSTATAATTITDTTKAWTVNALTDRQVRITSGAYTGAFGLAASNTATRITVNQWSFWDTTAKAFITVTPAVGSTYAVAYNVPDLVAAFPAACAWTDTAQKTLLLSACNGLYLSSAAAFFGDVNRTILIPRHGTVTGVQGSRIQLGFLTPDFYGTSGGGIVFDCPENTYINMLPYGGILLLGSTVRFNRPLGNTSFPRWFINSTEGADDGIWYVDATKINGQIHAGSKGVTIRTKLEESIFSLYRKETFVDKITLLNSVQTISSTYSSGVGAAGADIWGLNFVGTPTAGIFQRPLVVDTPNMPRAVAYVHGANLGPYASNLAGSVHVSSWSLQQQFSFYHTAPLRVLATDAADSAPLSGVAVGVINAASGAGRIITGKGGDLDTTTIAGTNTTTLKGAAGAFADIATGDYAYNQQRSSYAVVTKVDDETLTHAVVASQVSGDLVNFKSRLAYAPILARFQVTGAGGTIASPIDASKSVVVLRALCRAGPSQYVSTVTDYNPYTFVAIKYGYYAFQAPRDWALADGETKESVSLLVNPFLVADEATARAITGITIDGDAKTIVLTGDSTLQDLYDYAHVWRYDQAVVNDALYDEPITTADGVTFTLAAGWALTVSGTLSSATQILADKASDLTVAVGGFFEDEQGVIWNTGGVFYYASHVYFRIKDADTNVDIPGAVIGWADVATATRLGYNAAPALDTLVTDAGGLADGYFVYKIDSNTYADTKQVSGEYGYNFLTLPRALDGAPVGSSDSPEVIRLFADGEVTLSKANAALVAGITVDVPTDTIDIADNALSDAYDNLKYQVTADAEIDTGVDGWAYAMLYGLPLAKSGAEYTARTAATTYRNVNIGA